MTFESTTEYPAGSEVRADATSTTATEVQPRATGLNTLLLCPLLIIAVIAVGAVRAWSARRR
ncbi:hypothetical protein AB0F72_02010 [Actinoplanes sp. NPDC023936]|uniref:hypothetical protein n=1 Tax=Actinoplanes sp. NPDC023936 TaxID=3154910 RepID=UPI0033E21EB8